MSALALLFNSTPYEELTSYEARDLHQELWSFLEDTASPVKSDYFMRYGVRGAAWPPNSCYACGYAQKAAGTELTGSYCHKCPIVWPDECYERTAYFCEHEASPYNKWDEVEVAEEEVGADEADELRRQYAAEMKALEWSNL